jgi:hypothetical protein
MKRLPSFPIREFRLSRLQARSEGCQVSCGNKGAKKTICCPLPDPISRTLPSAGNTFLNTSRMGALFRSLAAEKVNPPFTNTNPRKFALSIAYSKRPGDARALLLIKK